MYVYTYFFHKPSQKQGIPLNLPKLIISNYEIQQTESIKFLEVLLDEIYILNTTKIK